jgi:8-oxo-dGTP pyrophosphatase MutT (NUDIX family)
MEFNVRPDAAPPRASATVVLLRDGAGGLEVFLQKRHGLSDVLGGAYVFPGGKVDAEDAARIERLDTPVPRLQEALGEPQLAATDAAALYVAAVREVFEETGVLFAAIDSVRARDAWAAWRTGRSFADTVEALDLRLTVAGLHPWSRWITPLVGGVIRKRFDTRFFVAEVPAGQQPGHDAHEAIESLWLPPRLALEQYWAGRIELAPPQIMSLAHLCRYRDAGSVLDAARSCLPPCIAPEPVEEDGQRVLCYPGDVRHSIATRALPGPTRLRWRNQRFEPDGGFEALLA